MDRLQHDIVAARSGKRQSAGVLACCCLITVLFAALPVRAAELQITVNDDDQRGWSALPQAIDQCVSGLMMRGEPQACRAAVAFIAGQQQKMAAAVQQAAADAKTKAEAEAKAKAEADAKAKEEAAKPSVSSSPDL